MACEIVCAACGSRMRVGCDCRGEFLPPLPPDAITGGQGSDSEVTLVFYAPEGGKA